MVYSYIKVTGKSTNKYKLHQNEVCTFYVGKNGERVDKDPLGVKDKPIRGMVKKYGYTSENSAAKAIGKLQTDQYVNNDVWNFTFEVESVEYQD